MSVMKLTNLLFAYGFNIAIIPSEVAIDSNGNPTPTIQIEAIFESDEPNATISDVYAVMQSVLMDIAREMQQWDEEE